MKKIFMPLILMFLADPVMANPATPDSECLQMYRNYLNDHNTSRAEIKSYLENCIPAANPASNDEPLHRKLLQIVDEEQIIITLKT